MPIDLDPFDTLDMNYDMEVDASDLQMYELQNHGTYSISDLDHDLVFDSMDHDLNGDGQFDDFQHDLNHNAAIDQFEQDFGLTDFKADINGDQTIDYMDRALAQDIYKLG